MREILKTLRRGSHRAETLKMLIHHVPSTCLLGISSASAPSQLHFWSRHYHYSHPSLWKCHIFFDPHRRWLYPYSTVFVAGSHFLLSHHWQDIRSGGVFLRVVSDHQSFFVRRKLIEWWKDAHQSHGLEQQWTKSRWVKRDYLKIRVWLASRLRGRGCWKHDDILYRRRADGFYNIIWERAVISKYRVLNKATI
jgi:hypothetical protein